MSGALVIFVGGAQLRADPGQHLGRQQQPRNDARAACHRGEILLRAAPHGVVAELRLCRDARHVDHEARIDPVIAGRNALAAVGADLRPALGILGPGAPGKQIEDTPDDIDRVFRVETGRLDHRARPDAVAAARAGIEDAFDPAMQRVEERYSAGIRDRHRHPPGRPVSRSVIADIGSRGKPPPAMIARAAYETPLR